MKPLPTSRLVPLVVIVASVALSARLVDVWDLVRDPAQWRLMQASYAEDLKVPDETDAAAAEAESADATPPEAAPHAPGPEAAPAEGEKAPDNGEKAEAPEETGPAPIVPSELTQGEIEVLQNLANRREEIEKRARELDAREALLAAAEQRVDQKVKELQGLKDELKGLLRTVDEQQQARINSLVKIYETMKPKDAAAVLEGLDMDVALDVVTHMREAKSAPILAAMTPQKASEITVRMMQRQKLPEIPAN